MKIQLRLVVAVLISFATINFGNIHAQNCIYQCDPSLKERKLFHEEFKDLGVQYIYELEYATPECKMPPINETFLSIEERKNLQKYAEAIKKKEEGIAWHLQYIDETVGFGIFADQFINTGDYIAEYIGLVLSKDEIFKRMPYDVAYTWTIKPPKYYDQQAFYLVDSKKTGNFTRFVNHSYEPNVVALIIYMEDAWHMIYVAMKDIRKGEQLLVDYGKGYWASCDPKELH